MPTQVAASPLVSRSGLFPSLIIWHAHLAPDSTVVWPGVLGPSAGGWSTTVAYTFSFSMLLLPLKTGKNLISGF